MRQIFLLFKKKGKDPENCGSYRPIALLNSDLKLLSKMLVLRLEKVLPFMKTRQGLLKAEAPPIMLGGF